MESQTTSATANLLKEEHPAQTPPAADVGNVSLGIKKPRRVIHFSDGVLEEYSSDEEDSAKKANAKPPVNPKTLSWIPYLWYYVVVATTKTLGACDFVGEKLAYFFGITSPKYQYAINEYNRLEQEERAQLDMEQAEKEQHREKVAVRQANRVYAETTLPFTATNPGTDL